MNRLFSTILLLSVLLLTNAQAALAAAVSVTSSGNGVFIVNGSGMDAVAGVDLSVSYDPTLLASPTVSQGSLISGALMAVNTNKPGSIKIAAVSTRPFPANGQIVTISFASHTGTGLVSVIASMINTKGSPVPGGRETVAVDSPTTAPTSSPGLITSAGVPFSQPAAGTNSSTAGTASSAVTTTAQTSSAGFALAGTVNLPGDVQAKSDPKPTAPDTAKPPAAEPVPVQQSEPPVETAPTPPPPTAEPIVLINLKGALEDFRTFKGERTPASLVALLNRGSSAAIRQEPPFTLSDGTATVKIFAELKNIAEKSPNFALQGARLISLTADSASAIWTITALPQAGASEASLTILTDREIIEFPLTIAPVVPTVTPVEADFSVFLKDSGATPPKHDLNNDARHDYLDDFIYTVNYLSKKSAATKPAK